LKYYLDMHLYIVELEGIPLIQGLIDEKGNYIISQLQDLNKERKLIE